VGLLSTFAMPAIIQSAVCTPQWNRKNAIRARTTPDSYPIRKGSGCPVITGKKLSMHSLRHWMKDKLRNNGYAENLSMEILGHAQGGVAANYRAGYAI
jgi:hypothetical protein